MRKVRRQRIVNDKNKEKGKAKEGTKTMKKQRTQGKMKKSMKKKI